MSSPSPARDLLATVEAGRWLTHDEAADAARRAGRRVTGSSDDLCIDGVPLRSAVRCGRRSGAVITDAGGRFLVRRPA